jgi:hypothetical protein
VTFPGTTQRCARCERTFRWRVDKRGRVLAVDDELVFGGRVELIGENEYFDHGVGHPSIMRARLHSEVCA